MALRFTLNCQQQYRARTCSSPVTAVCKLCSSTQDTVGAEVSASKPGKGKNGHDSLARARSTKRVIRKVSDLKPNANEEILYGHLIYSPKKVTFVKKSTGQNVERRNPLHIEMLPENMFSQIFGSDSGRDVDPASVERAQKHLSQHGLLEKIAPALTSVQFGLPTLHGANVEDHFHVIAEQQCGPYRKLVKILLHLTLPPLPREWSKQEGWTKYESGKNPRPVQYPEEDVLIFDVEECMQANLGPTLAVALSPTAWYAWVSKPLAAKLGNVKYGRRGYPNFSPRELINLETSSNQNSPTKGQLLTPKLVVGHNVSYDRARIKEQYWLQRSGTRFLDTMSLHVAVSGVTSYQKIQLVSKTIQGPMDVEGGEFWGGKSSLNNLNDVHKLYCGGGDLNKEPRNLFVSGTLDQIAENFDELASYCAGDVRATHEVLVKLYPMFLKRFPHPVTLAGMLEMSMAYLPVNQSWRSYIRDANETYADLETEAKSLLMRQANAACRLLHNQAYRNDPWMWDQDWTTAELTLKKGNGKKLVPEIDWDEEDRSDPSAEKFRYLVQQRDMLPLRKPHLPGYPAWYRKLCPKFPTGGEVETWRPGPTLITSSLSITPKLLQLTWDGYPLHKIRDEGWGLLIPGRPYSEEELEDLDPAPPVQELLKMCPQPPPSSSEMKMSLGELSDRVELHISKRDSFKKERPPEPLWYQGTGIWCPDVILPGCWFRRLPHAEGPNRRVGNPLSRDFVTRLSEGTLQGKGEAAGTVLRIGNALSYWRNNRERIENQRVTWLPMESLPKATREELKQGEEFGAILPQLHVCGTLTRRAVERTWLTAANSDPCKVGTELRAMVRAPPGYHIVGADVDSQELWLAAVMADAAFARLHGATAFGWRTLQGSKEDGTDLHSATAQAAGISRSEAKIINYARIYGAGARFATQLLKRFKPDISEEEARRTSNLTLSLTKGRKMLFIPEDAVQELLKLGACSVAANGTKALRGPNGPVGVWGESGGLLLTIRELNVVETDEIWKNVLEKWGVRPCWYGGTESAIFNRLEEIAGSAEPRTPFLGSRLSRALEPCAVGQDNFLTTRLNWVVQSSAVDFLHLMLVSMRALLNPQSRFILSFHDEVRYLVPSEKRYEAALALHTTNLLTRAFCARKLGIHDLPRSVAFFSGVEVDRALRKDASNEFKSPSNPHGLARGYGVPPGETLDIHQTLKLVSPDCLKYRVPLLSKEVYADLEEESVMDLVDEISQAEKDFIFGSLKIE